MENLFVPYELSLKLNELGFEENCLGWYCWINNNYSEFYDVKTSNKFLEDINTHKKHCAAPLWQQAFDFLREVHDLNAWVSSKTEDDGKTIYIPCGRTIPDSLSKRLVIDIIPYSAHTSFNEARQICLEELIKIVEKKLLANE